MAKKARAKPVYQDATRDVDARVRDLLGRMTLEEKVRQMSMGRVADFLVGGRASVSKMREFFRGKSIGCLQDHASIPGQAWPR